MFGIKMSCQLCCDLARPVMQQMFYVSRVVNLRDPCCNFYPTYVANLCEVG